MFDIKALSAQDAHYKAIALIEEWAVMEDTRNGPALALGSPLMMEILYPRFRLVTDPNRDANPFFHALEFVWMMAGRRDAQFVGDLVTQMWEYAEPHGDFHGAYGYRWINHFKDDQIGRVINLLNTDKWTRRAVLSMWDPNEDMTLFQYRDHPCNTTIYFRSRGTHLNMTVCNRSNDIIWGMLGANVVHMTLLHEIVALSTDHEVGSYYVMTNNAHVYKDLPKLPAIMEGERYNDLYESDIVCSRLLQDKENYWDFHEGAKIFCNDPLQETGVWWIDNVANPLYRAYKEPSPTKASSILQLECKATDWFQAGVQWIGRHRVPQGSKIGTGYPYNL